MSAEDLPGDGWRARFRAWLPGGAAKRLLAAANAMRDAGEHRAAASLYEAAIPLRPRRRDLLVQCAHMHKEAGEFMRAERFYLAALRHMPDDGDLAVQLGHFYMRAGRPLDADAHYARAAALRPGVAVQRPAAAAPPPAAVVGDAPLPELLPQARSAAVPAPAPGVVHLRQLGRPSPGGAAPVLSGVTAVRGFCIADAAELTLDILIDGVRCHRERVLPAAGDGGGARKFAFNAWLDVGDRAPGDHAIEIRLTDDAGRSVRRQERIAICAPIGEDDAPASDAIVTIASGGGTPEAQIRRRPSMIRAAARAPLGSPVRTILVQRLDQLGDLAVSVPAILRLRVHFPAARVIGLLSPANAELGAALGLFDEIVTAAFPEEPHERRRTMAAAEQTALAATLARHAIDLAIDLSSDPASRPLLRLSGARLCHGYGLGHDAEPASQVDGRIADIGNGHEAGAQAGKLVALVDWIAARATSRHVVIRRPADGLERLGLAAGERYAVLHGGARLRFSRWPHFADLAALIVARTALKVVMVDVDEAIGAVRAADAGRIMILPPRLPFDDFDAVLGGCAVFVGNDSGPKHLAALRGAKVVSVHMARLNWSEWAQEGDGLIVSRRVPCAGCAIHYEPEDCAKDFACIRDIGADEVMAAVEICLAGG